MAKKDSKKSKKQDNNRWFKDFKAELKKITWPSRKELLENITVVLSMVVIVAVIICVLDLAFKALNNVEINEVVKLKNSITATESDGTNEAEELDNTNETSDNEENKSSENDVKNEESSNIVISD